MANIGAFNPQTVEPQKPLEPIPTAWYNVQIVESEVKPTKAGDGHYLELVLEVIDGEYKNRKAWDRLNLDNASPMAKEIAYRTLSAICHATGTLHQISDSTELHGKPLMARIVKRPATEQYDESNDVRGYKKLEGGVAAAPTAPWMSPPPPGAPPPSPPQNSPLYPPEAIVWAKQNTAHPEAQKILLAITPTPPPPPAWTPPATPQTTVIPQAQPAAAPPPWQQPTAPPPAWTPQPAPPGVQPPQVAAPPWQKNGPQPVAAPAATGWTPPPPPAPVGAPPAGAKPPWEK